MRWVFLGFIGWLGLSWGLAALFGKFCHHENSDT